MTRYEYKVVPAPAKGQKAPGVKTPEGRFAVSVEAVLNRMGAEGWEYLRAELLPSEERSGLTGTTTQWRNVLVFRRPLEAETRVPPIDPPETERRDPGKARFVSLPDLNPEASPVAGPTPVGPAVVPFTPSVVSSPGAGADGPAEGPDNPGEEADGPADR